MSWLLIIAFVIIAFLLLEAKDIKHRIVFFGSVALILFLLGSIAFVFTTNDVSFTSFNGVVDAVKIYTVWLGNFFGNIGQISGYTVQQDWKSNQTSGAKNK